MYYKICYSILLILVFTVVFTFSSYAQDFEKANAYFESGDYYNAALEYELLIPTLEQEFGKADLETIPIYKYLLANSYFNLQEYELALNTYNQIISHLEQYATDYNEYLTFSLAEKHQIYRYSQDYVSAIATGKALLQHVNQYKSNIDPLDRAIYHNDQALAYFQNQQDAQAEELYTLAIKILESNGLSDNPNNGIFYTNLALSQFYQTKVEEAEKNYQLGIAILYEQDRYNYRTYTSSMVTEAEYLFKSNDFYYANAAAKIEVNTSKEVIPEEDSVLLNAYLYVGLTEIRLGNAKKSINPLKEAYRINEEINDNYPSHRQMWRDYICNLYTSIGETELATKCNDGTLPQPMPDDIELLNYQGKIKKYIADNRLDSALHYAVKATDHLQNQLVQNSSLTEEFTTQLNDEVNIASRLGKYQHVIDRVNPALKIDNISDEKYMYAGIKYSLAEAYIFSGQFKPGIELALGELEQGKKLFPDDKEFTAFYHNLLGLAYQNKADYINAIKYFDLALDYYKTLKTPDAATILGNIGSAYLNLGNLKASEKYFLDSKEVYTHLDTNNAAYATVLGNLGKQYFNTQEFKKSAGYYHSAYSKLEKLNMQKNREGLAYLNSLGMIYLNLGKLEQSIDYLSRSIENIEDAYSPRDPMLHTIFQNFGYALLLVQNFDQGLEILEQTQKIIYTVQGESNYLAFQNDFLLILGYHSNNQDDKAIALFKQTMQNLYGTIRYNLNALSEANAQEFLAKIDMYFESIYSFVYDVKDSNPEVVEIGLNSLLQLKGMLLSSSTALRRVIRNSNNDRVIETYDAWMQKVNEYIALQSKTELDVKLLDQVKEEAEKIELKLMELTQDELKSRLGNQDWKDVQKKLGDNDYVIEFYELKYKKDFINDTVKYVAFIIDAKSESPKMVDICTRHDLVKVLGEFGGNNLSYIQKIYPSAEQKSPLYDLIFKPLERHITPNANLVISPSGLLHKVSFQGISTGSGFITDKHNIKIVNSSSTLLSNRTASVNSIKPLLIGGVNYDSDEITEDDKIWKYLEGSKNEVVSIAEQIESSGNNPQVLTSNEAKETVVKESLKSYNIAHIATHGFFYPDPNAVIDVVKQEEKTEDEIVFRGGSRGLGYSYYVSNKNPMMRSGIALTGANKVWNTTDINPTEDGVFTAQDISLLDLSETKLMVLSACETGLGDIKGSEGVFGLQRSIKIAGAEYLIMSLWQVPDNETQEFMTLFYKYLLETKNIRKSFALTQTDMSAKYDPYYWAAFVLI